MDSFFEFIFGNLGFLIIVIGAIFSFIKRANQNQNPKQNQKQQPMDKRIKPFIPQFGDLFEETIQKPIEIEPKYKDVEPNPYIEKLREIENIKHNVHVDTGIVHSKKAGTSVINNQAINKKAVINGIVMAEILGPPRAKKKHSYSYLKRG